MAPLIALLIFGCAVAYLVFASSLRYLADLYPAGDLDGQISEGSYRLVSARLGFTFFRLAVELYPAGLWIRAPFPTNIVISDILIPWESISITKSKSFWFFFLQTGLQVARWNYRFEIGGSAGKAIKRKVENEEKDLAAALS